MPMRIPKTCFIRQLKLIRKRQIFSISLKLFFFQYLFLLAVLPSNSQTITFPVSELKKQFPEEEVIINKSVVNLNVELINSIFPVTINEMWEDQYVALQSGATAYVARYYNNYSKIVKHEVNGTGRFNRYTSQRCGDYEVDGIFYHDAKVCEFLLKFQKDGEHLKVKTIKEYNDLRYQPRIFFNDSYTIKNKSVTLKIPSSINLEILEMNFEGFEISKTELLDETTGFRVIKYDATNIPPSLGLDHLPGSSCGFPHILLHIKSYEKYGERINVIDDVDDLYQWYISMVNESSLSPGLAEITNRITQNAPSDSAKIAAIFKWVQDKIRYIAFENGSAGFTPDSPQNVYKNKYGDCKGMANLTKAMLKHLGFDARLCWVYSGSGCYSRRLASAWADNHMICALKLDSSFVFLDPTIKYSTAFMVNDNIEDKECLIEDGSNYIIQKIPSTPYASNLLKIENSIRMDGDQLVVDGGILMKGQIKNNFQYFLNYMGSEVKENLVDYFITNFDNNIVIQEMVSPPFDTLVPAFGLSYSLIVSNNVLDVGGDILLSLDLYNEFRDAKIDSTRKYDFEFTSRQLKQHEICFRIPDNTIVSSFPDSLHVIHPKYELAASYTIKDSLLLYKKNVSIKDKILNTDEFEDWNLAIDQLVKFYKEMIILKKTD